MMLIHCQLAKYIYVLKMIEINVKVTSDKAIPIIICVSQYPDW